MFRVYLKEQVGHLAERQHPWVFSGAISRLEGKPEDGDVVALYAHDKTFVAWGLYNSQSQIRIRLYSWCESEHLDNNFWRIRVQEAVDLRRKTLDLSETNAYRVINNEGDNLSGLTVDFYNDFLVLQFTSLALYQQRDIIVEVLKKEIKPRGIYLRTDKGIGESEKLTLADGLYWGEEPENPLKIKESGLNFYISLQTGQKTGFYLDQRDNRRALSKYAKDRSVLDLFCYTGGFSISAATAGAKEVLGVDVSETALKLAEQNVDLNNLQNIVKFEKGDSFQVLTAFAAEGRKFDLIVLDPPKFAKSKGGISSAIKGYISLNDLAIRCLNPSGILLTCSCSGRINLDQFAEIIRLAAVSNRRHVRLLEKRGASPDHPVSLTTPESTYLKCFICHIQ
ncbi:MAG: class I SAM-dependent rRNA methyltransferase [Candidatus Cloacimonetes bacterium]|nr:class I SAM-dependent rRNA methyltransferase [Candidatus Cloacimonadota bacterium]